MIKHRKIIPSLLIVYALTLVWGQMRLPTAAIKTLADYSVIRDDPAVSVSDEHLHMLAIQKWYLKHAMNAVDGTNPPHISAEVTWNWGVVARVQSSHYTSPQGAEWLDGLYVCFFGAWLNVHSFNHTMA